MYFVVVEKNVTLNTAKKQSNFAPGTTNKMTCFSLAYFCTKKKKMTGE